jgi:hypothetical protein
MYDAAPFQVLSTGVAVLLVDRFGRKILLTSSAVLQAVSIVALGVYFYLQEDECKAGQTENCTSIDTIASLSWLPLVTQSIYKKL